MSLERNMPDTTVSQPSITRLSASEAERYTRHFLLDGFGKGGQERLKNACVAVVGAGGLGCPVLANLATSGVGTIGIIDHDTVEVSNLQRQFLHHSSDVGSLKAVSARNKLVALNPHITVNTIGTRLTPQNACDLLAHYDIVIDASDNFETRNAISAAAESLEIPHVWGAALAYEGQTSVFWPPHGPSYRNLYPEAPRAAGTCASAGILGSVCSTIGSIMATETIKLIVGAGTSLLGHLTTYNAFTGVWRTFTVSPRDATEPAPPTRPSSLPQYRIDVATLRSEHNTVVTVDIREPWETPEKMADSLTVPLQLIEAGEHMHKLPRDTNLVIYCAGGVRSAHAVDLLVSEGYTTVRTLDGGINAWASLTPSCS